MQLEDLPSEIFFIIFSFLPAKDLAAKVSRVSTYWNSFSSYESLWKHHCLGRWGYLKRTIAQETNPVVSWHTYFKSNFDKKHLSFLILGAEGEGGKNERLLDVQQKVKSCGLANVEVLNVRTQAPTIEMLRDYNAVMFFSYHGFNQAETGNALAEFVELGGGVVICAYANCGKGNMLEGRWKEGQYDPLSLGATARIPNLKLGKVRFPKHPIMKGVKQFHGGEQSSHGDGKLHPDAITIANWSNGRPLVAELPNRRVAALNMYPPSRDGASGGWDPSTHGGLLLANALVYVATKSI